MINNRTDFLRTQITPFVESKSRRPVALEGSVLQVSYGKEETGYGITLKDDLVLHHGYAVLGVSAERLEMHNRYAARLIGKSSWARLGIHPNVTEIEPGWCGHVTLELTYHMLWEGLFMHWVNLAVPDRLRLPAGTGIGVLQWSELAEAAQYTGRHQDQPAVPMSAFGQPVKGVET